MATLQSASSTTEALNRLLEDLGRRRLARARAWIAMRAGREREERKPEESVSRKSNEKSWLFFSFFAVCGPSWRLAKRGEKEKK
jgi:hypothetical protein